MDKKKILEEIAEEIRKCKECRKKKFGLPVPGKGNPDAKILFLGEAPGFQESEKGEPFIGLSGKFLDYLFELIGIKREDVFITSPVKYYPGRRAPNLEEIRHGMIHTSKQIQVINPRIVVMLGGVALKAIFPEEKLKVSEIHGKVIEKNGRIYFPTFHPSAARRFPKVRRKMIEDFKKLKEIVEKLGLNV